MNERLRYLVQAEQGRIIVSDPRKFDEFGEEISPVSIDVSTPRTLEEVMNRVSEAPALRELNPEEKTELAVAILGMAS